MSYLKFDKSRMINLEYSLEREILRTNRKGAYHCTTLVECNTRKQHGLLVMPISQNETEPHVLLSSLDETVIQNGAEFNLGLHKYDGDHFSPRGHKYIREFDCDSTPKTIYRVGGVILSKEKIFSLKNNNIMIRYTLMDAHSQTFLRFRPYLAFRAINALTQENDQVDKSFREVQNGISTRMYEGYPELYMQFNKQNKFIFDPQWYRGIEYPQDQKDGFPHKEDLYVPGYFELPIKKGESIIFSAADSLIKTHSLKQQFVSEVELHTPRSSFFNCLKNSANQFIYHDKQDKTFILNSYPWYEIKARDQFIALPGLTLTLGKPDTFEQVLDSALPALDRFMQEGALDTHIKNIDDPDVLLWVMKAIGQYYREYPRQAVKKYLRLTGDIITYILQQKHHNLKVLPEGLLSSHGEDKPISWMEATDEGRALVPRTGCLVEFNALWYNALNIYVEMLRDDKGKRAKIYQMERLIKKVKESFRNTFINSSGYLYDYVDGDVACRSVRPNMIFAISLPYSPLSKLESKSILEFCTKELLTTKGLRSLSPKSEGYSPYYAGSSLEKAYVAYNGVAWPWLLGPYLEAYLKENNYSGLSFVERILVGVEEEMYNNCIGSISQLYDGNPPFTGHGSVSYATNVAAILSILITKQKVEKEMEEHGY